MATQRVGTSDLLDQLTEVFRTVGYEGATLSKLSAATGLKRASLYHRFPGGKREMAEAVLERAGGWFQQHILGPLTGPGSARKRLEKMADKLDEFYCHGSSSCLLDTLSFGAGKDIFDSHIGASFSYWIDSLARLVAKETGCSKKKARHRAEEAVIRIQGALVLGRGTGNHKAFQRVLRSLPDVLLNKQ